MGFDYETELKINNLARELLKSGGASSSADAHFKAREIILGNAGEVLEKPSPKKTEEKKEVGEDKEDRQGKEFMQKIEEEKKTIMQELAMLRDKMNEMVSEINKINSEISSLKVEVRQLKSSPATQTAEKPEAQPEVREAPQAAQAPDEKSDTRGGFDKGQKSTHPRSGGYAPSDVAIDKMFYFGNKDKK